MVPNFIGGTLPRCDQGDHEYYCSTMLTLFKPWQSGFNLKSKDTTWDETFVDHKFTSRQTQLINNFNICYGCLDAWDDFRAELKSGDTVIPNWDDDVLQNLGDSSFDDEMQCNADNFTIEEDLPTTFRWGELKQQQDMAIMKSVMTNAGWTTEQPGSLPNIDLHPQAPLYV
jgi:hypothetical protein